jgi:hypothetical protein
MARSAAMARGSTRAARPRDIADCLGKAASRGVRRRAFQHAQLAARWSEIVGAEVARHCVPVAMGGPAGKSGGGVLDVSAASAFAPRLAMIAPDVVERVNRFLGGPLVARLRIRHDFEAQVAVPAPPAASGPAAPPPPVLRVIADPGLRDALARLAAGIDASSGAPVFDAARSSR